MKYRLVYVAPVVGGMATMATEMAFSRAVGNVYGTSNLVWAAVIGAVMLYLAIGYVLGGLWADRSPRRETLAAALAWAGLAVGLAPMPTRIILRAAADAFVGFDLAAMFGTGVAVVVLFAVPMTLLGCIPTLAVRVGMRAADRAGESAGYVYALSTLGGLIGTFGAALVTIPAFGSTLTFELVAWTLLLTGMAGMGWHRAIRALWMAALLLVPLARPGGVIKPPPPGATLLYERESAYNLVQVVELPDGTRELLLNEGQGVHSVYHPDRLATPGTWDYFLAAPYFNAPVYGPERVERLALIGLAAGTIARQYTAVYGPIPIDGIEIDPVIVEVGRRYFGMTMPNLNVTVEDGRYALGMLDGDYTVIGVDAYRVPYVPWHLTTREFFALARDHLSEGGALAINVGRIPGDRRLVEAITATLLTVFPTVHTIDVPDSMNTILIATVGQTAPENLAANLASLPGDVHPLLRDVLGRTLDDLVPTVASDVVFTDDRAPVETMIHAMLVGFLSAPR